MLCAPGVGHVAFDVCICKILCHSAPLFSPPLLFGGARRQFKEQPVKGGDKIDLGGGHVMEFVMAPNLHWPDTMFSYDHATGVMYTCDAFGMHYCSPEPFDVDVDTILPHYR